MKVYNDELKAREIVEDVFKKIDMNNSGKVDLTGIYIINNEFLEFIVAANDQKNLLNKTKLE